MMLYQVYLEQDGVYSGQQDGKPVFSKAVANLGTFRADTPEEAVVMARGSRGEWPQNGRYFVYAPCLVVEVPCDPSETR
jgi:hypothetical protein